MSMLERMRRQWDRHGPARKLKVVQGDLLPATLPWRNLILTRYNGDDWSVGMRCPCGCGEKIELMVLNEASLRWDVKTDEAGRPTLYPSVFRRSGCRSHFWLRKGRIHWCE